MQSILEIWWRGAESNRRHYDFQSYALPTELPRHSRGTAPLRNDDHSTTQSDDGDRRRRVAREGNHPIDFSLNNRAPDLSSPCAAAPSRNRNWRSLDAGFSLPPVIRTRSAPGRGPRRCRRCARCRRSVESSPRSRRLSAAPPATSGGVSWRPDGRQATLHRRC